MKKNKIIKSIFVILAISLIFKSSQVLAIGIDGGVPTNIPTTQTGGKLKIGEECQRGRDYLCESNDCEESTLQDSAGNYKWYCDCSYQGDCAQMYGYPSDPNWDGDWDCMDGTENTYDLDYCVKDKDGNTTIDDIFTPLEVTNSGNALDRLLASFLDTELVSKSIQASITDDINDQIKINIPGLNFSKLSGEIDPDGHIYIPWIGEYIKAIYNYAIGIISIVAVLMIMMQGYRIIVSGGGENKTEGLKKIRHIFIGLIIAWSSYVILYTINPDLISFKPLKIAYITPILDLDKSVAGNEKISEKSGQCGGGFGRPQNLEGDLGLSGDIYQYAKYSYKYGPTCEKPVTIRAIILHYTGSIPSATAANVVKNWSDYSNSSNPGAICQIIVDREGKAYQVTEKLGEKVICHGGKTGFDYNKGGIGIEIMAANAAEMSKNTKQLEAVTELVEKIANKYNIPKTNETNNLINGLGGIFSHEQITRCEGAYKQKIDPGEENAKKIIEGIGGTYTQWSLDERCNKR